MNAIIEQHINRLFKSITGEDEYIFNPANKATEFMWSGFLSNRLSFCLETINPTLTVQSDRLLATWEVDYEGVKMKQVVEIGVNNISQSTFRVSGTNELARVLVTAGKLSFDFDNAAIMRLYPILLGKLTLHVPRGWFNVDGPLKITNINRDKLILAVLGKPLDKHRKERLTIHMCSPQRSKLIITVSSGDKFGHEETRYINSTDVHDASAVVRYVTDIMSID